MFAYSQEQRTNLRREGHGCGDSEAEGEDLENRGADPCHQDDGEEFVAKLGASGEIDCPVSAVRFHDNNELLEGERIDRSQELTDRSRQPVIFVRRDQYAIIFLESNLGDSPS